MNLPINLRFSCDFNSVFCVFPADRRTWRKRGLSGTCDLYRCQPHRYAGWKIARKYNLVTNFGKFMDPLADKLLVCSAMICLVDLRLLPSWIVIIIIAREFIISGFRLIAAEHQIVIAASMWGKFKTTFQMAMIILII